MAGNNKEVFVLRLAIKKQELQRDRNPSRRLAMWNIDMKNIRLMLIIFAGLILCAVFVTGFYLGKYIEYDKNRAMISASAEQQLALDLEILGELNKGNSAKALWMIQAGTAGTRVDY